MTFSDQITRIQGLLNKGSFPNKAFISQGIVLPLLQEVGWNIHDPRFVIPEYSVKGSRVDFTLLDRRERPVIFIEVKMLGNIGSAEEQLFKYAYHQGVPFLILTDGKEWNFFLPQEVGSYQDRKLYKLDLLERDHSVINEKYFRYLAYKDVVSGTALENAKDDFKRLTKSRETELTIPEAWKFLIKNKDELLLELLSDKVEDICGSKPDIKDCIRFLEAHYSYTTNKSPVSSPIVRNIPSKTISGKENSIYITIDGNTEYYHSARDVMINIITYLSKKDSNFLDSFQKIAHGRKRNYISRNKKDLYPGRPDFLNQSEKSREFLPGWWIGLNYSKRSIDGIIKLAIKHAEIQETSKIDYSLGS